MLVGGVIGGIAVLLVFSTPLFSPFIGSLRESSRPLDLLFIIPILLLVIFVHELGHLAGGMVRGMRFLLLIVGPFQWAQSATGISFTWNLNPSLMGGLAAAVPNRQRPLLPQLLGMVLGGPLASLLLGGSAIITVSLLNGYLPDRPLNLILLTGLFSLLIFLATAIPSRVGGMQSDGWQLIELLRGGAAVLERQLIIEIMAASLAGERPRDWDKETIGQLEQLESRDPLRRIAARTMALYHYWDRGEMIAVESLAKWLDLHLEQYPDGFRQSIHLELALLADESNRPDDFDRHRLQSKGGIVDRSRRLLLEATLAYRNAHPDDSIRSIESARRARSRGMDPGLNLLTTDQLDRLEAKADATLKTTQPSEEANSP